ncbi:hypothetical protein BJA5080_05442 [Bradyrhizobium diazoefficiens SEMIA 5080]|uniref:Uncharacterized protein n=1 Tax=Bradyrhizobium diazoefficiens SEMIA 5080 TaxID=754504 RepID=A0A837C4B6_9BRAD|nr:hypothetical protein BJA5080_05442 [Bradyrhizobium diazoefficiens SEMIA 5080]
MRATTSASADDSEDSGVGAVMAVSCKLSPIWDVARGSETGRVARKVPAPADEHVIGSRSRERVAIGRHCAVRP